jgi:hypothetical protein
MKGGTLLVMFCELRVIDKILANHELKIEPVS